MYLVGTVSLPTITATTNELHSFETYANAHYLTSAVTAIRLKPNVGNYVQYSTFTLYGIK